MEEVYAVVVPHPSASNGDTLAEDLKKVGEGVAGYKRPVGFVIWDNGELPKTATRKIKRLEVRKWLLDSQPPAVSLFTPKP